MAEHKYNELGGFDLVKGLPMFSSVNPKALQTEKEHLNAVKDKGILSRCRVYFSMTGPGWLQSAMTLGAGSSAASLFAGAFLGYKLLWIQPLAMFLGVVMLSAMAHQTLSTGSRPFDAMKHYIHPAFAWTWALAALITTVVWHIPQYALAAGMSEDIIKVLTGWNPQENHEKYLLLALGVMIFLLSVMITWSYGHQRVGVRIYEKCLKGFVWLIIAAFGLVVLDSFVKGKIHIIEVLKGLIPSIPQSKDPAIQERSISVIMGAFSGAIGVNMTFLFPYTLLARGWSKEHRELAKFDLFTGMLLPYSVTTGLIVIATGSILHNTPEANQILAEGKQLTPVLAASMLEQAGINHYVARIIFGLGIVGMVMTTISMQMLVAGFAICEFLKIEPGGWTYRLGCLIPAPAVLGVLFWQKMSYWIAIPTAAICGILLPIAYVGFFLLNNNKRYLSEDTPKAFKAVLWNTGMLMAITISSIAAVYYVVSVVIPYCSKLADVLK
jgi:Mn2+/Fe2+ NRAMP family transporter